MIRNGLTGLALLAWLWTGGAGAGDGLSVEGPWARASAGMTGSGAAYLTIRNPGPADDRLVAARSPVAARVELHTHRMDDGVMRMREVAAIPVPAGGVADLRPGGLHVMLIGLDAPLAEGTSFSLTLEFERAGPVTVDVPVRGIATGAPAGHAMPGMPR